MVALAQTTVNTKSGTSTKYSFLVFPTRLRVHIKAGYGARYLITMQRFTLAPGESTSPKFAGALAMTADCLVRWSVNQRDPYLLVHNQPDLLISVFDDLRYDRADVDMLSPGMRKYLSGKLAAIGFRQISGNRFVYPEDDICCVIPKNHALGMSPYDATRYTTKRSKDYFVVTPTQTAARFIADMRDEKLVAQLSGLIRHQPINIERLVDFAKQETRYQHFLAVAPHIRFLQRTAVAASPLSSMRALR